MSWERRGGSLSDDVSCHDVGCALSSSIKRAFDLLYCRVKEVRTVFLVVDGLLFQFDRLDDLQCVFVFPAINRCGGFWTKRYVSFIEG